MPTAAKTTVIYNYIPKVIAACSGDGLENAAKAGGQIIETYAKINVEKTFSKKSGGAYGLGGSIHTIVVEKSETKVLVHIGPSVIYGRIQELGGVIKPVFVKMLSWVNEAGERIFAKEVHLPARPYLRPAVDEHKPEIGQAIAYQIKKAIQGAMK